MALIELLQTQVTSYNLDILNETPTFLSYAQI